MNIVYDITDGTIVSSLDSNLSLSDGKGIIATMFPGIKDKLAFASLEVSNSFDVFGAKVVMRDGIPYGVERAGESVCEISEEQFKSKLEERRRAKSEARELSFHFKFRKGSFDSFVKMLVNSPYTKADVAEDLRTGSYLDDPVLPVGWWGSFTDAGGYACMNRSIVFRLHNHHIVPHVSVYKTIDQIEPDVSYRLKHYTFIDPKKRGCPYVYAFTPMPHIYRPGKKIFYTMMETSSLHKDFVKGCNLYSDEVWVPSQANMELFRANGVRKPIKVIPLGIDEQIYFSENHHKFPVSRYEDVFGQSCKKGVKTFKFLCLIQWNMRKGYDALIQSFVNAFDDSDDVCLVFATQYPKRLVINDLKRFLPRNSRLPQVLLYNRVIRTEDMPGFYENFDTYVHMSRGEGFSLTQIEAAACGLPVISCYHSGMTEYLTQENSYLIPCPETAPCDQSLTSICYYYQGQRVWKLGKKQIDAATDHMLHVWSNWSEAQEKAELMRKAVRKTYTWEATTERVAGVLRG